MKEGPATRERMTLGLALLLLAGPVFAEGDPSQAQSRASATIAADLQQGEILIVDLTVNSRPQSDVARAELRPGSRVWLLDAQAWQRAGFRPIPRLERLSDGTPAGVLSDIPGVALRFEPRTLTLLVDAPAAAFVKSALAFDRQSQAGMASPASTVMLNYDATWQTSFGSAPSSRGASLEMVWTGAWGQAVNSVLWTDDAPRRSISRLDSYWRYDMHERMETLVVGDTISSGGAWSRPARYGGLRWGRDFTIRPGFVTQPTLTFGGEAALPSTVDVLIDNVRRLSTPVQPGPFDLRTEPLVTGSGEVNLVVRDLLGRERIVTQSFYASPQLLSPGLSDYSLELGALRRDYGDHSSYRSAFTGATWRHGVSARWTAGGRAEIQSKRQAIGADFATLVGTWASLRSALAFSRGNSLGGDEQGQMLQVSLERTSSQGGFTLQHQRASAGFAPFGESEDDLLARAQRVRSQSVASVSSYVARATTAALGFARQVRGNGTSVSTVSLSTTFALPQGSLSISVNRARGETNGWYAGIFFSIPLDSRTHASSRTELRQGEPARTTLAAHRHTYDLGWSWRVEASTDEASRARGNLQLNGEHVQGSMDLVSSANGQAVARAGLRGTVGFIQGTPFASRYVGNQGVAVVHADDVPNAVIRRNSQVVAKTNEQGRAVVTGLVPWSLNRIELDLTEVPLDVALEEPVREVRMYPRSGVVLQFGSRRARQAVVILRTSDGGAVPQGASVTLEPQGTPFAVGLRGEAWLTDLGAGKQQIRVEWPSGRCVLTLPEPDAADAAPALGPYVCGKESS